jgi:rare lipoprotein A
MATRRWKITLLFGISITVFFSQIFAGASNASNYKIQKGLASWYSENDPGINKHTANNEVFDDAKFTAAMWGVPFNQLVRVTNLDNGRSVIVRVNDRGPHKRFVRQGRLIDLSKGAFNKIGDLKKGLIRIRLELI